MDHTEALPDDALAAIIGRLGPRDLAASRCVRKAWRAVVDARRLLLPHLLPHSVEGIFANYYNHHRPQFLARPSTRHPGVDYGNLHFLPGYTNGRNKIADHCNGLLLYGDTRQFCVVNPATRFRNCRFSLSDSKYRVIGTPIDANKRKEGHHYLGSSETGVYFANIHDQIPIWYLSGSNGEVEWVLKSSIGIEPLANRSSLDPKGICSPWIFDDDPILDRYGNNTKLEEVIFNWNWDDDNILDTNHECRLTYAFYRLLGFHPYKEIAFFLVKQFELVAYHLDSSKVQYIGCLRPTYDTIISVEESFLYTPCMMGDLSEKANSDSKLRLR
uniref:F-box domain-containing protein n=1 Tax=Aegilops tauschii TaxID=37682 RepID=M8BJJ2_AEGTA